MSECKNDLFNICIMDLMISKEVTNLNGIKNKFAKMVFEHTGKEIYFCDNWQCGVDKTAIRCWMKFTSAECDDFNEPISFANGASGKLRDRIELIWVKCLQSEKLCTTLPIISQRHLGIYNVYQNKNGKTFYRLEDDKKIGVDPNEFYLRVKTITRFTRFVSMYVEEMIEKRKANQVTDVIAVSFSSSMRHDDIKTYLTRFNNEDILYVPITGDSLLAYDDIRFICVVNRNKNEKTVNYSAQLVEEHVYDVGYCTKIIAFEKIPKKNLEGKIGRIEDTIYNYHIGSYRPAEGVVFYNR